LAPTGFSTSPGSALDAATASEALVLMLLPLLGASPASTTLPSSDVVAMQ